MIMSYIDGFVAAAPTANHDTFKEHAENAPWCSRSVAR
jgi:uncharacterized protein YbaA (DUF1428 family)